MVALSDADGTHVTAFSDLGQYPEGWLEPSLDGRYLVSSDGTVIAVNGERLSRMRTPAVLTSQQSPARPDPMAGQDRYLIVVPVGSAGAVSAVALGDGTLIELGTGEAATGDPQEAGAFVSVSSVPPSPSSPAPAVNQASPVPDAQVELRDAGRPAVVLATSASLNRALGRSPGGSVALAAYPSPDGERVAITVADLSGNASTAGIVVVDRRGGIHYTLSAGSGPAAGEEVAWSPDGRALAFGSPGGASSGLVVWTLGRLPSSRADPTPGAAPLHCLWAPDASAVLCATIVLNEGMLEWNVAGAQGGPVVATAAIGQPVVWLKRSQ
jgi:hypothetical protein